MTRPLPKYIVRLADEERPQLENLSRTGKRAASVIRHARILLKADIGEGGPGWDDERMAEAVDGGAATVERVRQAFVDEGLASALFRKKPTGRQYRKLDGVQEAPLNVVAAIRPEGGRLTFKKRTQAVAASAMGDSPAGQCRVCLRHGRGVGSRYSTRGSGPPGGVSG